MLSGSQKDRGYSPRPAPPPAPAIWRVADAGTGSAYRPGAVQIGRKSGLQSDRWPSAHQCTRCATRLLSVADPFAGRESCGKVMAREGREGSKQIPPQIVTGRGHHLGRQQKSEVDSWAGRWRPGRWDAGTPGRNMKVSGLIPNEVSWLFSGQGVKVVVISSPDPPGAVPESSPLSVAPAFGAGRTR